MRCGVRCGAIIVRRVSEARPIVPRLREVSHVVARPLLQTLGDLDAAVRPQLGGAHLQLRHHRSHHALALARTRNVVRSGEEREVRERLRRRRLLLRLLSFREHGQGGSIVAVLASGGTEGEVYSLSVASPPSAGEWQRRALDF